MQVLIDCYYTMYLYVHVISYLWGLVVKCRTQGLEGLNSSLTGSNGFFTGSVLGLDISESQLCNGSVLGLDISESQLCNGSVLGLDISESQLCNGSVLGLDISESQLCNGSVLGLDISESQLCKVILKCKNYTNI